jgi:succinate dehydrogenase/fumarate reductase-like Fe-S protein
MALKPVTFILNGEPKAAFTEDGQNLLDMLRRGVGDPPPKYGCAQGSCGACTVLIDGEPQLACLVLAELLKAIVSKPPRVLGMPNYTRCRKLSCSALPRNADIARREC